MNIKIFAAIICSLIFASTIIAQEKPPVVEFARVSIEQNEEKIDKLVETLERFAVRLSKEPKTTKGFIQIPENIEISKNVKLYLKKAGIEERVDFLGELKFNSKYYWLSAVKFYLVPQNAELPRRWAEKPCLCTTLDVIAHDIVIGRNSVLTFKAKVGDDDIEGLTYKWWVSAGVIVEGQGTSIIKVEAGNAEEVTATVRVGGFCETCMSTDSETTKIQ